MLKRLPPCILEVERKFRSLAVSELSQRSGKPPFKSLRKLPPQTIRDAYYDDKSQLLTSAGAWIRKRDGRWQAKIKKGGDYANSRFEELCDPKAISTYIERVTGQPAAEAHGDFGLDAIAAFSTERRTWIADDDFHIVLDTMDFGHQVGEIELQRELAGTSTEEEKQRAMQEMDQRIVAFLATYSWAFTPGQPKGKLTAYFDRWPRGG